MFGNIGNHNVEVNLCLPIAALAKLLACLTYIMWHLHIFHLSRLKFSDPNHKATKEKDYV